MLDLIVTLVALATLGSYIWSVRNHFETAARQAGTRLIDVMVLVCAVYCSWMTWQAVQEPSIQLVGIAVMLGGLVLFWATIRETRNAKLLAAFSDKNPASLVSTGPYSYVRHPFYSAYILFWLGFAISTGSLVAIGLSLIMVVIYWQAAKQEEQKFSGTQMADDYAAFAKGRKRFIPFLL